MGLLADSSVVPTSAVIAQSSVLDEEIDKRVNYSSWNSGQSYAHRLNEPFGSIATVLAVESNVEFDDGT